MKNPSVKVKAVKKMAEKPKKAKPSLAAKPKKAAVKKATSAKATLKSSPRATAPKKITKKKKKSWLTNALRPKFLPVHLTWLQLPWLFGIFALPALIAVMLWRSHQPIAPPAPAQLESQPVAQQAPVAPSPPQVSAPVVVAQQTPAAPAPPAPAQQMAQTQALVPAQVTIAPVPVQTPAQVAPAPVQVVAKTEAKAAPVVASGPIDKQFNDAYSMPLGERVKYWSDVVSNRWTSKQTFEKLGRGPDILDPAPLLPKKQGTYDCTTYVETVAALTKSQQPGRFYENLVKIRYKDAETTFGKRNHFPEADWIPNNIKAGVIRDVTGEIAAAAGVATQTASKSIRRADWLKDEVRRGKVSRSIASSTDPTWTAPTEVKLTYLPYEDLPKFTKNLPDGSIVNLVRKGDQRHPVLISHQGFIVKMGNQVLFRHASTGRHIKTVPLASYLKSLHKKDQNSWPLLGINVSQLQ